MMTDGKNKNGFSQNVDFGHPKLSQQEVDRRVESRRARFLAAARGAQSVSGKTKKNVMPQMTGARRLVKIALSAALVLIVLGAFWMAATRPGTMLLLVDVAEAGPFMGVNAVIISSFDRHCVGNVYAYEVAKGSKNEEGEKFCARSNSNGVLIIPPDNGNTERHYILKHDGRKVGELATGGGESRVSGFQRITVNVASEQQVQEFAVSLNPGEAHTLTSSLRIELGSNSQDGWSGTVELDDRWPPEFNHGNVVGGIVSVSGESNADLRIQLAANPEVMATIGLEPESLALISNSQEYDKKFRLSPDYLEYWKALCHRGWYDCGNPPEEFLDQENHSVDQAGGVTWVSFSPVTNRKYAIKAPLNDHWEGGTTLARYFNTEGEKIIYPSSSLLSHLSPKNVTPLYDVMIKIDGNDENFFIPVYPKANFAEIGLGQTLARGYLGSSPALVEATNQKNFSFEYWIRQFDFTLTEMSIKGPYRIIRDPEPGKFEIEFEPPRVGFVSKLRLTGDFDWINGRTSWDFDGDKNPDAFGLEAEYLVTQAGVHKISALVPGNDFQKVIVRQQLNCLPEGIIAFRNEGYGTMSIVEGINKVPEINTSVWVINPESLGNRMDASLSVMPTVGPDMYLKLQKELIGKQIREVRLTTIASPRGGDYQDILVSGSVAPISNLDMQNKHISRFREIEVLSDGKPVIFDPDLLTWRLLDYHIQEAFTNNKFIDHADPMSQHWPTMIYTEKYTDKVKKIFGFAFENIPEEQELNRLLREYFETPTFSYRSIDQEKQEVCFTFNMRDVLVTLDMGLLVTTKIEHQNRLYTVQYEVYSGPDYPSRVEVETSDGQVFTTYHDYSTFPGAKIGVE